MVGGWFVYCVFLCTVICVLFFFFQAEDGIRDVAVTGVQTCALPILLRGLQGRFVPPGPSGSPSRGRPDVLPTGRNFYTLDTRAIPTQAAWELGQIGRASCRERV